MKKIIVLSLTFALFGIAYAAPPPNLALCPPIKSLSKNDKTNTWSAEQGQWKSYELSFVDKIKNFVGAQWTGANVGQVTCVYRGASSSAFPILLVFHTLTYVPKDGKWSKDLGGYRNCKSLQRKECPFLIRIKSKSENVIDEAKSLRIGPKE